jgi:hypothetical protein
MKSEKKYSEVKSKLAVEEPEHKLPKVIASIKWYQ